jgi:RNA polymerase sigma-70 factor (ECF subfamily)
MVDTELIIRCQKGDLSAFEQLYKTCSPKALRTAFSIVDRYDLAEEILQEAFCECFRGIGKLHAPEAFEVWFYRILVATSWRLLSDEKKSFHEQLEDYETHIKDPNNCYEDIEDGVLINAINRLSVPIRTTVILHYYNDMSVSEIARVMNCFPGTVKSRLFNGRKKLAAELKKQPAELLGGGYVKGTLEGGVGSNE